MNRGLSDRNTALELTSGDLSDRNAALDHINAMLVAGPRSQHEEDISAIQCARDDGAAACWAFVFSFYVAREFKLLAYVAGNCRVRFTVPVLIKQGHENIMVGDRKIAGNCRSVAGAQHTLVV